MKKITVLILCAVAFILHARAQQNSVGIFDEQGDVGNPIINGNTVYNAADQTYTLSAAGKNVWAKQDQFQFAWKKIKGDFIIKATVHFIGAGV